LATGTENKSIVVCCRLLQQDRLAPKKTGSDQKAVGEEMPEIRQTKKDGVYQMSVSVNGRSIETRSFTFIRHARTHEIACLEMLSIPLIRLLMRNRTACANQIVQQQPSWLNHLS